MDSVRDVLVIGDSKEENEMVRHFLKEDFVKIITCEYESSAVKIFNKIQVGVIILAYNNIDDSIECYSRFLCECINSLEIYTEVIVFCKASESKLAFEACKNDTFDDYVITRPLYDLCKLRLSVIQAHRRVISKRRMIKQFNGDDGSGVDSVKNDVMPLKERVKVARVQPLEKPSDVDSQRCMGILSSGDKLTVINDHQVKVAIIDDSEIYVAVTEALLLEGGFSVVCIVDSQKAVDILVIENPDVILLDYNMPGLNGADLLKIIRGHENLCSKPIIMLTGDSFSNVVSECFSNGANDFIVKPGDYQVIAEKINKVMSV